MFVSGQALSRVFNNFIEDFILEALSQKMQSLQSKTETIGSKRQNA